MMYQACGRDHMSPSGSKHIIHRFIHPLITHILLVGYLINFVIIIIWNYYLGMYGSVYRGRDVSSQRINLDSFIRQWQIEPCYMTDSDDKWI